LVESSRRGELLLLLKVHRLELGRRDARDGFRRGFSVQSPMDPNYAHKLGREPRTYVIVDATLKAP